MELRRWTVQQFGRELQVSYYLSPGGNSEAGSKRFLDTGEALYWLGLLRFSFERTNYQSILDYCNAGSALRTLGSPLPEDEDDEPSQLQSWSFGGLRTMDDAVEAAVRDGFLRVRLQELPALSIPRKILSAPPSLPTMMAPVEEAGAWFASTIQDYTGKALSSLKVAFSSGGKSEEKNTDGSGFLRFNDYESSFGSARLNSEDVFSLVEEDWKKSPEAKRPTTPYRYWAIDGAENGFSLESEKELLLVIGPTPGKLHLQVLDRMGRFAIPSQAYQVKGPEKFDGETNDSGELSHPEVIPGDYELELTVKYPEALKLEERKFKSPIIALAQNDEGVQIRKLVPWPTTEFARLHGAVFDSNKSFPLPSALPQLAKLRSQLDRHRGPLLIVGHCDATTDSEDLEKLSKSRAASLQAFLEDEEQYWLDQYGDSVPKSSRWGSREDDLMMSQFDGYADRLVETPRISWFQERYNLFVDSGFKQGEKLKVDNIIGPKTRGALIRHYFMLDGIAYKLLPERKSSIIVHGSAEHFSLKESEHPDDQALVQLLKASSESENSTTEEASQGAELCSSRVEFFFFDESFGMLPEAGASDGEEYHAWRGLEEGKRRAGIIGLFDQKIEPIRRRTQRILLAESAFNSGSAVLLSAPPKRLTNGDTASSAAELSVDDENSIDLADHYLSLALALRHHQENPGRLLLPIGHTDRVGADKDNQDLSKKRAKLVHSLLSGNRDAFSDVASDCSEEADVFGLAEWAKCTYPVALQPLAAPDSEDAMEREDEDWEPDTEGESVKIGSFGFAGPQYFGSPTTESGSEQDEGLSFKETVEAFQSAYNENIAVLGADTELKVDGAMGPKTWGAFYDLINYHLALELGEDAETLAELRETLQFLPLKEPYLGLGEEFPLDKQTKSEESSKDRRVEILFFDHGQAPDLEVLEEAPLSTELYSESFEHLLVPPRRGGAARRALYYLRLLDYDGRPMTEELVSYRIYQEGELLKEGLTQKAWGHFLAIPEAQQLVHIRWKYTNENFVRSKWIQLKSAETQEEKEIAQARLTAIGYYVDPSDGSSLNRAAENFAVDQELDSESETGENSVTTSDDATQEEKDISPKVYARLREFFEQKYEVIFNEPKEESQDSEEEVG